MTNRSIFALSLLAVIVGAYLYFNDFFRKPTIQITPSIRPGAVSRINPDVYPVSFMLDGKYQLTTLKVVRVEEAKTNKYPRPVWHMISDSASAPTKIIIYGQRVQGMKPSVPRATPEPLLPRVPYRLIIETKDEQRGQVDFLTQEAVPPQG
jgi:hypothetical protein